MVHIKTIKIPKLPGKHTIANSKLFIYIDSDFKNWKADEKSASSKSMNIDIFEMDKDARFDQMMSVDNLMTQDQILYFVEKYKDLLRQDGYATFFPFKSNGEVFVANVRVSSGGLCVCVRRFSRDRVWGADYRGRVVVPQLESKDLSPDTLFPRHSCTLPDELKINDVIYKRQ